MDDTYKLEKVMESEAAIVRVYRPIITEAERKKRMDVIKKKAAALLIEREAKNDRNK